MMRPPATEDPDADPEADSEGGGGTTCGVEPACPDTAPGMARCSAIDSCGAGAMTEVCAMFRSPRGRAGVLSTLGGGSMTEGCEAWKALPGEDVWTSGGGATTEFSSCGRMREMLEAGTSGAGAIGSCGFSDQATIFGKGTSRFSLMLGGVTMVWV